jgi:hypothetical protein
MQKKTRKKTGRPPKIRIQIPLEAQKRIEDLSAKSGMRIEWITEYALKVGLLATYNKLMPIIQTDEEINKTWEEVDAPSDNKGDTESPDQTEPGEQDDSGHDQGGGYQSGEETGAPERLGSCTVERGLFSEVPEVVIPIREPLGNGVLVVTEEQP